MSKARIFRFRDRASYKSSEVVGLFVVSVILGGAFCLTCVALDYMLSTILGR
jgi:hypothetical protein